MKLLSIDKDGNLIFMIFTNRYILGNAKNNRSLRIKTLAQK